MVVAPLVFAALLIAHPMGDTFYEAASEHNTAWLTVHVGAAVFFPLMAAVVWYLLRGADGRAASSPGPRCSCSPSSTPPGK